MVGQGLLEHVQKIRARLEQMTSTLDGENNQGVHLETACTKKKQNENKKKKRKESKETK